MDDGGASNTEANPSLEEAIIQLRNEKEAAERDFSSKRAVFKKLYMDKEAELSKVSISLQNCQVEKDALQRQLEDIRAELEDVKTAAAVSEVGRQDEISLLRNHYQEEVASLQPARALSRPTHIVRESVAEAVEKASAKYAEAKQIWKEEKREMQARLDEAKRQGWQDKDAGVLDVVAKTFRRMTHSTGSGVPTEGVITSASEDGEENSAENLEEAMRRAQADVDTLKSIVMPYEEEIAALKQKVRDAYAQLDSLEESTLKKEVDRVRQDLDVERGNVAALRTAWQRDNDQFLHQQRCQLADLRRMEALLSDEQKTQLASMTARETKGRDEKSPTHSRLLRDALDGPVGVTAKELSSPGSPEASRPNSSGRRSLSNQDLRSEESPANSGRRGSPAEVRSLFEFSAHSSGGDDFFETSTAVSHGRDSPSQRVVSEREWTLLQQEVTNARRRLARPCELCGNYEDQLQTLQVPSLQRVKSEGNFAEKDKKLRLVQGQLEKAQKLNLDLRTCISELESRIAATANGHADRIAELVGLLQEKESSISALRSDFTKYKMSLDAQLEVLFAERHQLYRDLTSLQREHESLLERSSAHSRRLQSENLDLPRNPDDLHIIVLQLRENLAASQAAREHMEEKLRGELAFLRDQMKAELQEKAELESTTQEELARLQSIQSEYNREQKVRAEVQGELELLRKELTDLSAREAEVTAEVTALRHRNATMANDLATAEEVQKDFVTLSQSLQIQLEHLRQEGRSVRWQDKEDTIACGDCGTAFDPNEGEKTKRRCKHCARIFCAGCCAKTVRSAHNRPLAVCNVCHTLLVQDAVPYFSQALPTNRSVPH